MQDRCLLRLWITDLWLSPSYSSKSNCCPSNMDSLIFNNSGSYRTACRVWKPSYDKQPKDKYCKVSRVKTYNHIRGHISGNGHICSAHRIRLFGVTTFTAAWTLSRRTLLRLPLIMPHKEKWRLWYVERRSWIQAWHNILLDDSFFSVQYSKMLYTCHRLLTFDIGIRALHMVRCILCKYLQFGLMVILTQIGTFPIFYVQLFCPAVEACKTLSSKNVTEDHFLHVLFWPSSIHRVYVFYPGWQGLQIWQILKTSGHGLMSDWPAAPLQLILWWCGA